MIRRKWPLLLILILILGPGTEATSICAKLESKIPGRLDLSRFPLLFAGTNEIQIAVGESSAEIDLRTANMIQSYLVESMPDTQVTVVTDLDLTENDFQLRDIVLVGGPAVNAATNRTNAYLPVRFDKSSAHDTFPYSLRNVRTNTVYDNEFENPENVGLLSIIPNPWNAAKYVLVAAGLGANGTVAAAEALLHRPSVNRSCTQELSGDVVVVNMLRDGSVCLFSPSLWVSPKTYSMFPARGTTETVRLDISNGGNLGKVPVRISLSGSISDWFTLASEGPEALPENSSSTVEFRLSVPENAAKGSYRASVIVSSVSIVREALVKVYVDTAEVKISKLLVPTQVAPGDNVTVTVTARNIGNDSSWIRISDSVPGFAGLISGNTNWDGEIYPNEQVVLTYQIRIGEETPPGHYWLSPAHVDYAVAPSEIISVSSNSPLLLIRISNNSGGEVLLSSFTINRWELDVVTHPGGRADFVHIIDMVIRPRSTYSLDVDTPTWRYENPTFFGLLTPFSVKVIPLSIEQLHVSKQSNRSSTYTELPYDLYDGGVMISSFSASGKERLRVSYSVDNYVSSIPPIYSVTVYHFARYDISQLEVQVHVSPAWGIASYGVSASSYNRLTLKPLNVTRHGFDTVSTTIYLANVPAWQYVMIQVHASQIGFVGEWGEASFWYLVWALIILVVVWSYLSQTFKKKTLPDRGVYALCCLGVGLSAITYNALSGGELSLEIMPPLSLLVLCSMIYGVYASYLTIIVLYADSRLAMLLANVAETNNEDHRSLLPMAGRHGVVVAICILGIAYAVVVQILLIQIGPNVPLVGETSLASLGIFFICAFLYLVLCWRSHHRSQSSLMPWVKSQCSRMNVDLHRRTRECVDVDVVST